MDASVAKDLVVVIEVISVRDFERTGGLGYLVQPDDGNAEIIWASPPPFRVTAKVITQLYGPPAQPLISFKTHSHWGHRFLTDGNLKLVHLITDGKVLLMPDEQEANVGSDAEGNLFVPAYPSEIAWLPCGTNALMRRVTIRDPTDKFGENWQEPVFPSPSDVLAQDRIYYVTNGARRYPRFAIPIEAISRFLMNKRPKSEEFQCFKD